jgi:hypothetical protein
VSVFLYSLVCYYGWESGLVGRIDALFQSPPATPGG